MQSLSHNKYRTAGPRLSNSQKGSVPPIYTKGDTLYYADVVAGAPRERSCARREARERMEFSRCARGRNCRGRSHLFTQKGTLYIIPMSLQRLRRNGPALAGKLGKGWSFRAVREGRV